MATVDTSSVGLIDRLVDTSAYARISSLAGMTDLALKTLRTIVTPPFPWVKLVGPELAITLRRCLSPLMMSMVAFSGGMALTLVAGLLEALGATDRAGAGNLAGWEREPAYWVTAMIFAGVVGSAMTADLGARKIREELDALRVLGIDPEKQLVVPRVVALTIAAPILGLLSVLLAMGTAEVAYHVIVPNSSYVGFLDSAKNFATTPDILSLIGKLVVTGFIVGIVCCYKGIAAKGGAEGVGRAVNQSVLITFVSLWILNDLWNAVVLANTPAVQVLHG